MIETVIETMEDLQRPAIEAVRRYYRLEIDLPDEMPDGPILFIANHGFGTLQLAQQRRGRRPSSQLL